MFNYVKSYSQMKPRVQVFILKFLQRRCNNSWRTTNGIPIVRSVITFHYSRIQIDRRNTKTKSRQFIRVTQGSGTEIQRVRGFMFTQDLVQPCGEDVPTILDVSSIAASQ